MRRLRTLKEIMKSRVSTRCKRRPIQSRTLNNWIRTSSITYSGIDMRKGNRLNKDKDRDSRNKTTRTNRSNKTNRSNRSNRPNNSRKKEVGSKRNDSLFNFALSRLIEYPSIIISPTR